MVFNATWPDFWSAVFLTMALLCIWHDYGTSTGRGQISRLVAWGWAWQFFTPKWPFYIDMPLMAAGYLVIEVAYLFFSFDEEAV